MKQIRTLALGSLILLSACATTTSGGLAARPGGTYDTEVKPLHQAYLECMLKSAVGLEASKSSAADIAEASAAYCRESERFFEQAYLRYVFNANSTASLTPSQRVAAREASETVAQGGKDVAIGIVVKMRTPKSRTL